MFQTPQLEEFKFDIQRTVHRDTYILLIKANKMHYFSTLFCKELYMFRTKLLSIIRSFNTVFTATGICHTSYVSEVRMTSLTDSQHNKYDKYQLL